MIFIDIIYLHWSRTWTTGRVGGGSSRRRPCPGCPRSDGPRGWSWITTQDPGNGKICFIQFLFYKGIYGTFWPFLLPTSKIHFISWRTKMWRGEKCKVYNPIRWILRPSTPFIMQFCPYFLSSFIFPSLIIIFPSAAIPPPHHHSILHNIYPCFLQTTMSVR